MTTQIPTARRPLAETRSRYEEAAATPVAQVTDGLTVLAGLYLALSPWIVGFNGVPAVATNNLIMGLVVAGLGIGFASMYGRLHGLAWLTPVLGVWTIISQWVMSAAIATTSIVVSNVIAGAIILVLGLAALGMTGDFGLPRRRG